MNEQTRETNEQASEMTLDPPGSIAVIGGGPLGLEAALYGRFLGYDVTVFERGDVGQSLRDCVDQPLPMLPSVCLTPLAWSAISAQLGSGESVPAQSLPLTIGQWLEDGLQRLAKTDLLRGRVRTGHEVIAIELLEVAGDTADADTADADTVDEAGGVSGEQIADEDAEEDYIDGDVPADFRLTVRAGDTSAPADQRDVLGRPQAAGDSGDQTIDFEAVIVAIGDADPGRISGLAQCQASPYFFWLGQPAGGPSDAGGPQPAGGPARSAEQRLRTGWSEIVAVFATLGGRRGLDLYRPIRF